MPFELSIVTPQGQSYHGKVDSVVLPGSEGDFGVLPDHQRFLSPLRIGAVEISSAEEHLHAAIAEGFVEVGEGRVVVLAESCELADEIDVAKAELDRERAREGLDALNRDEDEERYAQYEAALAHAHARLEVSEKK